MGIEYVAIAIVGGFILLAIFILASLGIAMRKSREIEDYVNDMDLMSLIETAQLRARVTVLEDEVGKQARGQEDIDSCQLIKVDPDSTLGKTLRGLGNAVVAAAERVTKAETGENK